MIIKINIALMIIWSGIAYQAFEAGDFGMLKYSIFMLAMASTCIWLKKAADAEEVKKDE